MCHQFFQSNFENSIDFENSIVKHQSVTGQYTLRGQGEAPVPHYFLEQTFVFLRRVGVEKREGVDESGDKK